MAMTNAERQARFRAKAMGKVPKRSGPYDILRLFYSITEDLYYLVSHDETTALPLPRDLHGQWDEITKNADDRLNCHAGFVPWPPGSDK